MQLIEERKRFCLWGLWWPWRQMIWRSSGRNTESRNSQTQDWIRTATDQSYLIEATGRFPFLTPFQPRQIQVLTLCRADS